MSCHASEGEDRACALRKTIYYSFSSRQMAGGGIRQDISMQAINLSNMKNLIEWIKQSNLDPYDPENAFLINLMKV